MQILKIEIEITGGLCLFPRLPLRPLPQWIKYDELVDSVDKLGLEVLPDLIHYELLHALGRRLARRPLSAICNGSRLSVNLCRPKI